MIEPFDESEIWRTTPKPIWHWYVGGLTMVLGLGFWIAFFFGDNQ